MRALFRLLAIVLLAACPFTVRAQVAKDCGAVQSCMIALPSVAAGDLVVLVVRAGKTPTVTAVGFQLIGQADSPDPHRLTFLWGIATVAGPITAQIAAPGASTLRVAVASFPGPWATAAPGFASAASTTKSSAPSSGPCPQPAALCIGGISTANAATLAPVAGETLLTSAGAKVFLVSGAPAASGTLAAADLWAAGVASFTRPAGDVTAPTVQVTAPGDGTKVSGIFAVSANANDDVGVSSLQFLIDGNPTGALLTSGPYSVQVDTSALSPGTHTLSAKVADAAGNTAVSSPVSVTVVGQLFEVSLRFDDGSPYAGGGLVTISEFLSAGPPVQSQSDIEARVSPSGNVRWRWPAINGTVYTIVVSDPLGIVLWRTGTQLTPSSLPTSFSGVAATVIFLRSTGAWSALDFTVVY